MCGRTLSPVIISVLLCGLLAARVETATGQPAQREPFAAQPQPTSLPHSTNSRRAATLNAIRSGGAPTTVLRAPHDALAGWLTVPAGGRLESHMAIVDPMGEWMMRVPADPEPMRLKRDVERLLRASAGWDRPGR